MSEIKPIQITACSLIANGFSIVDTAEYCKISRITIHNWLKNDEFFVKYINELKLENIEILKNKMQHAAYFAISTMTELMSDSMSDVVKLNAAKEILAMVGFTKDSPSMFNIGINSEKLKLDKLDVRNIDYEYPLEVDNPTEKSRVDMILNPS